MDLFYLVYLFGKQFVKRGFPENKIILPVLLIYFNLDKVLLTFLLVK